MAVDRLSPRPRENASPRPLRIEWHDAPSLERNAPSEGYEIRVILSGRASRKPGATPSELTAGDVLVAAPGQQLEANNQRGLAVVHILFAPEWLQPIVQDAKDLPGLLCLFPEPPRSEGALATGPALHLSEQALRDLLSLIRRLSYELEARQAGYLRMTKAIFSEIILSLARSYHHLPPVQTRELFRVSRAVQMMETQFAEPIRVAELAHVSHMSLRHFQRVFQKVMGTTPLDYLLNLRLMKAQTLLEQEDRRITDIALDCGFSDSNYFSRLFRQKIGRSPSQIRQAKPLAQPINPSRLWTNQLTTPVPGL